MYTAHIFWALGTLFLLPNWLGGLAFLPGAILIPFTRIGKEESRLVDRFGAAYEEYRKKIPALFPRLDKGK
jgi:protein-S-isoprenylcysteine O-methyltransferase Ste14